MCIFSRPIIKVSDTQIFARATSSGTQFIAYKMNYESVEENAMILPIPIKRPSNDAKLRFIDMRGYESFFDDLADGFPFTPPSFSIGCSGPKLAGPSKDNAWELYQLRY